MSQIVGRGVDGEDLGGFNEEGFFGADFVFTGRA